ncbi:MAG: peptidylprolyl isomerase [Smithella sp.]
MAIKTTIEQLEEVQAAISSVMSGQGYEINGRRLTRANLKELTERETMLLSRYRQESGSHGATINIGTLRRD